MRSLLLAILLLPASLLRAGGDPIPVGARSAGLAHANLTLIDLWCVRGNQAGLAGLERPMAGLFYQQHWLSPDLSMQGLAFALPLGNGTIAASGHSFGFDLYREQQFGLAYAMRFGEGLRAGVQFDYLNVQLGEGYGSRAVMIAQAGVQARLTDALWFGAHLFNPGQAQLADRYDEKVPTVLRAGFGYSFSDKLLINGAVEKDIDRDESIRAGLEYHPAQALFFRIGVSTGPTQGHFGLGLRFGRFDADLAVSVRSQLGATPQLSLNYRFE
jgi:hypothetical protein